MYEIIKWIFGIANKLSENKELVNDVKKVVEDGKKVVEDVKKTVKKSK